MCTFLDKVLIDAVAQKQIELIHQDGFTSNLLEDRIIFYSSGTISKICYNKAELYAFAKERKILRRKRNAGNAEHGASGTSSEARIAELEMSLKRLRERGRLAVAQRDEWERRALAAEEKLAIGSRDVEKARKYELLKRFLAKELHPDRSNVSGTEKLVRTEMFKVVWGKIEEIDKI